MRPAVDGLGGCYRAFRMEISGLRRCDAQETEALGIHNCEHPHSHRAVSEPLHAKTPHTQDSRPPLC